jgi:hypothetical protein
MEKIRITAGNLKGVPVGIRVKETRGAKIPGTDYIVPRDESEVRLFHPHEVDAVQAELASLGYQTEASEVDVVGGPV